MIEDHVACIILTMGITLYISDIVYSGLYVKIIKWVILFGVCKGFQGSGPFAS